MIINSDTRGRSLTGKFARRPLIEYEPDDFPPDSMYWKSCAMQEGLRLSNKIGAENAHIWAEMQWPGDTVNNFTFKEIALEFRGVLKLDEAILFGMLECTCKPDSVMCCAPCRAAARIRARSAVETVE